MMDKLIDMLEEDDDVQDIKLDFISLLLWYDVRTESEDILHLWDMFI